jgi:hypothetical protein
MAVFLMVLWWFPKINCRASMDKSAQNRQITGLTRAGAHRISIILRNNYFSSMISCQLSESRSIRELQTGMIIAMGVVSK